MGRRSAIGAVSSTRQGKTEFGALVDDAAGFDPAAVAFDDAAGERESDAGSHELLHAVQALEYSKQLVHVRHVEADAVVAHDVNTFGAGLLAADLDDGGRAIACVFQGVVDEVIKR